MIAIYHVLSAFSLIGPALVCMCLFPAFVRFMTPTWIRTRVGMPVSEHDGLFAAVFLLLFNRAWLSARHIIFGTRLEDFAPMELPYLNAALAWALIALIFLVMMLLGYRRRS